MTLKYVVKGQLADMNMHDKANRNNKFGGAALKKEQTEKVYAELLDGKRPKKITRPCTMEFVWYYSGKFDFDNIRFATKYVLDGMVKAKILPNDNQKWVLGFGGDTFIKVKKGKERVEIFVSEYNE